jgi:hypothetical protein
MTIRGRQYFFLSDYYRWGGCVTFTAHLLHSIRKKRILRIGKRYEKKLIDFGYNIECQIVTKELLDNIKNPFITDLFKNFLLLKRLKRIDITIVIHDPTEIFRETVPYLKYWNIICIRKSFQQYLRCKYGLNPRFLYHPFYPYTPQKYITSNGKENIDHNNIQRKTEAVSLSRVEYGKNIEMIMKANRLLESANSNNFIKIYGPFNPNYVNRKLGKKQFEKYYFGTFEKSFHAVSKILDNAKFMIDLSLIRHDGGGTQYTFLEAIHNDTALIINRRWIEDVDPKYCDFKEGYNCYAISSGQELAEIISNSKNIDSTRITNNAKKLMDRHIKADWQSV